MNTYEIREEGNKFATIEAESAEQALDIAEATYPRRRVDYNLSPDDAPFMTQWRAFGTADTDDSALRDVQVPSV